MKEFKFYIAKDEPQTLVNIDWDSLSKEAIEKAAQKGFMRWAAERFTGQGQELADKIAGANEIMSDPNGFILNARVRKAGAVVDPIQHEAELIAKLWLKKNKMTDIKAKGFSKVEDYIETEAGKNALQTVMQWEKIQKAAEKEAKRKAIQRQQKAELQSMEGEVTI